MGEAPKARRYVGAKSVLHHPSSGAVKTEQTNVGRKARPTSGTARISQRGLGFRPNSCVLVVQRRVGVVPWVSRPTKNPAGAPPNGGWAFGQTVASWWFRLELALCRATAGTKNRGLNHGATLDHGHSMSSVVWSREDQTTATASVVLSASTTLTLRTQEDPNTGVFGSS